MYSVCPTYRMISSPASPPRFFLLCAPGLVTSDVTLDDDGFLFKELEVPPAEEASDVPLDGDGSPGLGTGPLFFQLLVQKLLEEHLIQRDKSTLLNILTCTVKISSQSHKWADEHLGESQLVLPLLCAEHVQQGHRLLSV